MMNRSGCKVALFSFTISSTIDLLVRQRQKGFIMVTRKGNKSMGFTNYGYITRNKRSLIYSLVCLLLSALLTFLARSSESFAQWYGHTLPPFFVNTVGRFFSIFPFSVFEFMIYTVALGLLLYIVWSIYLVLKRAPRLKMRLFSSLSHFLCILTSLLLIFTLTAAIHYSSPPITAGTDTSIKEHSRSELLGLSFLLVDEITKLTNDVIFDEQGFLFLEDLDLGETAAEAMRGLEDRYPSLSGYYPSPKPILFSKGMSHLGITGIFSPFTIEANYNRDIPPFLIPYTVSHEFAHLKGFMREDEAGFLAYLACRDSRSPQFQYSGTLNALLYTLNELYNDVDRSIYDAVFLSIPESVRLEMAYSRGYWKRHTTAVTTIAKSANDKYLMANAQTDGVKSYGRMVDLLLEEYEHQIMAEYSDLIPENLLDNIKPAELN